MNISLREICHLVGGQLTGDGSIPFDATATLSAAKEGDITLADRPELAKRLAESAASAAIVPRDFTPTGIPLIAVDDVHEAFAKIVAHFHPPREYRRIGVSPAAFISLSACLADDVDVHPGATIGDDVTIGAGSIVHSGVSVMAGSKIGENVTIFPNAVLYENTIVGPGSIIHACAVLGAYGFGYETTGGRHRLSAQLGSVVLEADVEIGACTTIDRGTYGPTLIGEGTKIDNQVMVAHNCRIGRHNMLCSQVGIAGSTTTGDYVVMAGQVGVRDHVHIGEKAVLGAKAGVVNNVPDGALYIGIPATPERDQKLRLAVLSKLPQMRKQLKAVQRTLERLQQDDPPSQQDAA